MITIPIALGIGLLCVTVEAFFSGSEIAMVSANKAAVRTLAAAGNKRAIRMQKFYEQPERLLATTLLGTNIATITFSVTMALAILNTDIGISSELLAILLVTPMTLILGEIVPKTVFQYHADSIALRVATPLWIASIVLRPGVLILSALASAMSALTGTDRERAFVTRDELELLVDDETNIASELSEEEREMIANVLELSQATSADVMVPLSEVTALNEKTSLKVAALEVADKQHSRMPVYSSRVDDVVGVVHVFDILQANDTSTTVGEVARTPIFVPESRLAVDLLVDLQGSGGHIAMVVDEYGGTIGIVTVEDILEEIVGEIDDEYDQDEKFIVTERPGVWRVEARCSVERLNETVGLSLPESDEYETVAGLLLDHFRRIPEEGESMVCDGVTIRVLNASDRAVRTVQVLRRLTK